MASRLRQRRPLSAPSRRERAGLVLRQAAADAEALPAYVRECAHGWHVYNGRDEACGTFAKTYDRCRLRGRTIVLCRCRPVSIEVTEFRWDESRAAFIEHRRYFDDSPACGDGF